MATSAYLSMTPFNLVLQPYDQHHTHKHHGKITVLGYTNLKMSIIFDNIARIKIL